jgi:hypothetical protein
MSPSAEAQQRRNAFPRQSLKKRKAPPPRPILPLLNKAGPNRIIRDIASLLELAFVVPQSVIKKIPLPDEAMLLREPSLPRSKCFRQIVLARHVHDQMNMIRHQDSDRTKPFPIVLVPPDCAQHVMPDLRLAKMIHPALEGVDCDKESRLDIHPGRQRVIQMTAHDASVSLPGTKGRHSGAPRASADGDIGGYLVRRFARGLFVPDDFAGN